MVLIILEGPDGGGKSTFVSKLVDELSDAQVLHKGPPKEHLLDEYEKPLLNYEPCLGRHVICDRWHLGEWVYPQVLHRETTATPVLKHHIEMFLNAKGAVLVYVTQPLTTLMTRLEERGDDLVNIGHLRNLKLFYERAIADTALPVVGGGISIKSLIRFADATERSVRRIGSNGSYIGVQNPHTLLIGERTSFRTSYGHPYPPAFGPYSATSGDWMLNALHHYVRKWWLKYGFANAYEEDLAKLYERLGAPNVVALGRKADVELERAGVPHGAVPHPQYVRRFLHREQSWYVSLIHQAEREKKDLITWRP